MFIGHALLAFAIAVRASRRFSVPRRTALRFGVVAALFAAIPDIDVVYAPVGLLLRSVETVGPDVFWETANVIHRGPTHSLVMAGLLAVAVTLWTVDNRAAKGVAVAIGTTLVAIAAALSGTVGGVVVLLFVVAGFAVATGAHRSGVPVPTILGLAAIGLLSHPFGDLFTGSPPPLLYPIDVTLVAERVALHPDPTGHLLAAFALELATVWLAVVTYARVAEIRLTDFLTRRAALGSGYAVAAVIMPAPTLEQSAHFVFSVLAVGVVGAPTQPFTRGVDWREVVVTGLSAVTIGAIAYALVYVVL
jgi:membrane-bound metal-dependent hydrolase YbcI (DUF457 family)